MRLIVGLGNPGPAYARHRHNVGYMAADRIADRHGFPQFRRKFQGAVAEGTLGGLRVLLLKPLTFMNLSGQSVAAALDFFKLEPPDAIVIHDELDLAPGKCRIKKGGGAGGHNGIRSIDSHIGPDYWRLRIGIGHPGDKALVHGHVLSDFDRSDQEWLEPLIDAVAEAAPLLAEGSNDRVLTRLALAVPPPEAARA